MRIVGAALPRTGTTSLKVALQRLGVGPVDHMLELCRTPGRVRHWIDLDAGRPADLAALLGGFGAVLDVPGCLYWRELAEAFPAAHVLLTVRDPASWYESYLATLHHDDPSPPPPELAEVAAFVRRAWSERFLAGVDFRDRDRVLARYRAYHDEVRASVPPERLLVVGTGAGWEPLCRALGVRVPDEPYPHENTSAEVAERARRAAEGLPMVEDPAAAARRLGLDRS